MLTEVVFQPHSLGNIYIGMYLSQGDRAPVYLASRGLSMAYTRCTARLDGIIKREPSSSEKELR